MIDCYFEYDVVHTKEQKEKEKVFLNFFLTKYAYKLVIFSLKLSLMVEYLKLLQKLQKNYFSTNDHDPYLRGMFNWVGF